MRRLVVLTALTGTLVGCGVSFEASPQTGGVGGSGGSSSSSSSTGGADPGPGGAGGTGARGDGCVDVFAAGFSSLDGWTPVPGNNGAVELGGGGVEVTAGDGFSYLYTSSDFTLGPCGVRVRVEPLSAPGGGYFWLNAAVAGNSSNRIEFAIAGTRLEATYIVNDGYLLQNDAPYGGQAHRWLRMRRLPPHVLFETSADGVSWSLFHQAVEPDFIEGSFYFSLGSAYLTSSETVRFHDFAVRAPTAK